MCVFVCVRMRVCACACVCVSSTLYPVIFVEYIVYFITIF